MKFYLIAAVTLFLFGLGFAGREDYREAQREHANYCHMVEAGHWPDYRGDFEAGRCEPSELLAEAR